MTGRPDGLGITRRGGLAVDQALVVHRGEFTLHHDHLGRRGARGDRIETAFAQRFGQSVPRLVRYSASSLAARLSIPLISVRKAMISGSSFKALLGSRRRKASGGTRSSLVGK
jgi:hypothetical protein